MRVLKVYARKRPIQAGFGGVPKNALYTMGQMGRRRIPYPRGFAGMSFRAYGKHGVPQNPLGAVAGSG